MEYIHIKLYQDVGTKAEVWQVIMTGIYQEIRD